jgi:hypothetical protein
MKFVDIFVAISALPRGGCTAVTQRLRSDLEAIVYCLLIDCAAIARRLRTLIAQRSQRSRFDFVANVKRFFSEYALIVWRNYNAAITKRLRSN